jgi:hypothetical protein
MPPPDPKAQKRRFLFLFPSCLLAGFALLQVPPVAVAISRFAASLVSVSAGLIHLFGAGPERPASFSKTLSDSA